MQLCAVCVCNIHECVHQQRAGGVWVSVTEVCPCSCVLASLQAPVACLLVLTSCCQLKGCKVITVALMHTTHVLVSNRLPILLSKSVLA